MLKQKQAFSLTTITLCGLHILLLLLPGCSSNDHQIVTSNDTVTVRHNDNVTSVNVVPVKKKEFTYIINSTGKIKAEHEQLIVSETEGKLVTLEAIDGKTFGPGNILAVIKSTSAAQKLERAKFVMYNAEKEYASELLGYENLLKDAAPQDAENIKKKLKISTGLTGALQDIKDADQQIASGIIRAPFYGVIANSKMQDGQFVTVGKEMFTYYNPDNLLIEVKILEGDINLLKYSTIAQVSPVLDDSIKIKAVVYQINPHVDENGIVLVKLRLQQLNSLSKKIFPGMNCRIAINIPLNKTLIVPKEAIVMRNDRPVVFSYEDGKAKWNYITIGRDNGEEVEIKQGLSAGQLVIVTNNLQLSHDAPVKKVQTRVTGEDY
jgi:membrane fusion protein (multidrug efflux system)